MIDNLNKAFIIVIIILSLLSGCWDRKEVEELLITDAIVFNIENSGDKERYQVSLIATNQSGAIEGMLTSEDINQPSARQWVSNYYGTTLQEVFADISVRSPKFNFLVDNRAIIIGDEIAKKGLYRVLDFVIRNRNLRISNYIIVSTGDTMYSLSSEPEYEDTLASEIISILERGSAEGDYFHNINLKDFTQDIITNGKDTWAPILETILPTEVKKENINPAIIINKTALFHDDKMVGILGKEETQSFLILKDIAEKGILTTKIDDRDIGFSYTDVKVDRKLIPDSNNIRIDYNITLKGNIDEIDFNTDFSDKTVESFELQLSKSAKEQLTKTIGICQNLGSDALGIGRFIHIKKPELWNKYSENWEEIYQDINVNANVKVEIVGTELLGNSIVNKKSE